MSLIVIENLDASLNFSRPVNSGVMSALRMKSMKSPAAPLLCCCHLA
jgi:hypothetical protein